MIDDISRWGLTPWVLAPAAFFVVWSVLEAVKRLLGKRLTQLTEARDKGWATVLLTRLRRPVTVINSALAFGLALQFLPREVRTHPLANHLPKFTLIVAIYWALERAVTVGIYHLPIAPDLSSGAKRFLTGLLQIGLLFIGLLIGLETLGVSITPFIASLGVGSLAVALALQDTLSNFFSGVYLLVDKTIREGDFVKIDGTLIEGRVEKLGLRTTKIGNGTGNLVTVPNSKIASSVLVNYSLPSPETTLVVAGAVSYTDDLDRVEKVTLEVAKTVQKQSSMPHFEPVLRYHTFADSSVNFNVVLRASSFEEIATLRHVFIKALQRRYQAEGIKNPHPQRTIHLTGPGKPL